MIELLGVKEGKEFEAATHLRRQILAAWPDIGQSAKDHIKIFVGLKLYGYRLEDIDLVVIGHLSEPRGVSPSSSQHRHRWPLSAFRSRQDTKAAPRGERNSAMISMHSGTSGQIPRNRRLLQQYRHFCDIGRY